MAEIAVIKTGGKQYVVSPGKKIKVEKLPTEEGSDIEFSEVLLVESDKGTEVGAPLVEGATVKAKVLKQGKAKKIVSFKYKAKKREQSKKGHRQPFSEIEITEIQGK